MPHPSAAYKKWTVHIILMIMLFFAAVFTARFIAVDENVQHFVANSGYFGIFATALISGFNIIFPIHVAAFTPIFLAAGFPLIGITIAMVLGITLADLIAYFIGHVSKAFAYDRYKKQIERLEALGEKRFWLPIILLFLWATFAPVPNELLLIPLAIIGVPLQYIILPLFLGNTLHLFLLEYGISLLGFL